MAFGSSSQAGEPGGARSPGGRPSAPFELVGTLEHVFEWASLIAVERPGHLEARLHVNGETRIAVDGRLAGLRALRLGQPVRVVFDLVGDAAVASDILAPGTGGAP